MRIGFVSGDFRSHPVGHFLEASLRHLAQRRIELVGYTTDGRHDEVTERIKSNFSLWRSLIGLSDEAAARLIRDDGVQVLIDLGGHTANNRLTVFAWRPAPVQATWLGFLATTGVREIDFVIADEWTLCAPDEANFVEKAWRIPKSYLCFTPPVAPVEVNPLPALGNGFVTFGSFNHLIKMNDSVVALWAKVLTAVPNSRLLLKSQQFANAVVRQKVFERYAAHGIAADRLMLEGLVPRADYLRPFHRVDIALDPFPYPGITTSVENLWMGVPVLTLAGQTFLSRQGAGLLMNAGLPDWIAADEDDYVARATLHAGDLDKLAALRNGLRQRVLASPIFDAGQFAENFETAVYGMWARWNDG